MKKDEEEYESLYITWTNGDKSKYEILKSESFELLLKITDNEIDLDRYISEVENVYIRWKYVREFWFGES